MESNITITNTTPKKKRNTSNKLTFIALALSLLYWITLYISITHPENKARTKENNNKNRVLNDFHKPAKSKIDSSIKNINHNKIDQSLPPPIQTAKSFQTSEDKSSSPSPPILTAYIEKIDQSEWNIKPLPLRQNAHSSKLKKITYPQLNSCQNLPSQWPVDDDCPTNEDQFLPWIHDVFPSSDGKVIHFIAQNKRRCRTGDNPVSAQIKKEMQPQVSLFQHVPIKRINSTRYKITSHEEADEDGQHTRFICRFKPIQKETLSTFRFDYNYAAYRKVYAKPFTEEGFDNHVIWTSQLLFDCPVPEELWEVVRDGSSVIGDYATMFVDLVPIRTPPRYGLAKEFLPPKYELINTLNATEEFGTNHIIPLIEDSGRWENIPICKPSLQTYDKIPDEKPSTNTTKHTLVACTWTSDSYQTRSKRNVFNGKRRLKEWITFHLLAGFDHIYIYDNSGAFSKETNLAPVTDAFPSNKVTRIDWPAKICNNNPSTTIKYKDKGERSSQYAAEASCLLRFGPHTKWMASMDIDEYMVPMGKYDDMKNVLEKVESEGFKVFTFKSMKSFPIYHRLAKPSFDNPVVKDNKSILYTYNCDKEIPKIKTDHAEKQIYRTDYVLMHFIHYSVITTDLILPKSEFLKRSDLIWRPRYNDKKNRQTDELNEAVMIHARAVNKDRFDRSQVGFPWPNNTDSNVTYKDKDGNFYNCFQNEYVEKFWIPKFHEALGFPMEQP